MVIYHLLQRRRGAAAVYLIHRRPIQIGMIRREHCAVYDEPLSDLAVRV